MVSLSGSACLGSEVGWVLPHLQLMADKGMWLRRVVIAVYFAGLYSYQSDSQLGRMWHSSAVSWDRSLDRTWVTECRSKPLWGSVHLALLPWIWASHPTFRRSQAGLFRWLPKPCRKHRCCTGAKKDDVVGKAHLTNQGDVKGKLIIKILATVTHDSTYFT